MTRALDSAIGLPRRLTRAFWMLGFLMPADVRSNFMMRGTPHPRPGGFYGCSWSISGKASCGVFQAVCGTWATAFLGGEGWRLQIATTAPGAGCARHSGLAGA